MSRNLDRRPASRAAVERFFPSGTYEALAAAERGAATCDVCGIRTATRMAEGPPYAGALDIEAPAVLLAQLAQQNTFEAGWRACERCYEGARTLEVPPFLALAAEGFKDLPEGPVDMTGLSRSAQELFVVASHRARWMLPFEGVNASVFRARARGQRSWTASEGLPPNVLACIESLRDCDLVQRVTPGRDRRMGRRVDLSEYLWLHRPSRTVGDVRYGHDGTLHLHSVRPDGPGSSPNAIMRWMCSVADRRGVAMLLNPVPFDAPGVARRLSPERLTAWYGRFGFRAVGDPGWALRRDPEERKTDEARPAAGASKAFGKNRIAGEGIGGPDAQDARPDCGPC